MATEIIPVETIVLGPAVAPSAGHDFTVYDAYLENGATAIPLIYHEGDQSSVTKIKQLRPVRQDVGNNPWETVPDSGDMFAQGDFSHGSGQQYFHQPSRDPKRFLHSEGFDVLTTPGKITHLRATARARTISGTGRMAVANDLLFIADDDTVWRGNGAFPGTYTAEDPYGGETTDTQVYDLVSSGDELYAALSGRGIHKRSAAGVWTHFNDVAALKLAWMKDRLMAADGQNIYEIAPGSVTAAPAAIVSLPSGWQFKSIFEGGAFIYACATNVAAGLSRVYALTESNGVMVVVTSTPAPRDQVFWSGVGYLNLIYLVGGIRTTAGGYDPIVYQAFTDGSGGLTYVKLAQGEEADAADLSCRVVEPLGETVAFGWSLPAGSDFGERTGLALHHLGRDAVVNFLKREGAGAARISDIQPYLGRVLFMVAGDGVYYDDPNLLVPTATMVSSVADWNNAGTKVWDRIDLSTKALPPGTSLQVDYTKRLPEDDDWVLGLTDDVPGSTGTSGRLVNVRSRLFGLRITSTARADQTLAPELLAFAVRSNAAPDLPEYELVRTIRILGSDTKNQYAEPVFQDPDDVRFQIMNQVYFWVTFFEAGITWDARVTAVASVVPAETLVVSTGGDTERDAYFLQISMDATRSA